MRSYLLSTLLMGITLSNCTNVADTENISKLAKEAQPTTQSVETARQAVMTLNKISSETGFDSFVYEPKKHTAQELVRFYTAVDTKFHQRADLPALKHRMLYTLINDYNALDKASIPNDRLVYYLDEIKALPTFDASLALAVVKRLDISTLNTNAKVSLTNLRDELVNNEASVRQSLSAINNPTAVQALKVDGNSQSSAMQEFIKKEYIKAVQKNGLASLELLATLKSLLHN